MKSILIQVALVAAFAALAVRPSEQASECETKRTRMQAMLSEANRHGSQMAILVPNCNADGSYAPLQCHANSNFCQCWDKEGSPLTQPKKNLKKCACLLDRTRDLKNIRPSETTMPDITTCEIDGSYTAKQCDRSACWCVNPDTGAKLSATENKNKSGVKC